MNRRTVFFGVAAVGAVTFSASAVDMANFPPPPHPSVSDVTPTAYAHAKSGGARNRRFEHALQIGFGIVGGGELLIAGAFGALGAAFDTPPEK